MLAMAIATLSYAQKTPLLDRELFFGNPEISSGQLSPDGKWISFMKEYDGIMNVWVKRFDEPFDAARPLTDSKRPLYGYFWSRDGKYILFAKDKDGDENINIFAVDPSVEVPKDSVPDARNLTPMEEVTAQIYQASYNNPDIFFVGLNDRDKSWHDLYKLTISTGELEQLYENTDRITSYGFDWDDNLRLMYQTDEKGTTTMLYKKGDELIPILETPVTESAGVSGWNEDNTKMYLISNMGDLNLSTLFLMDPETKEMTKLESDPKGRVDLGGIRLDRNTRKMISTSYTDDKTRIYWKDKDWEKNYKFLEKKFPGREVGFQSSTSNYSKFLVSVSGDRYASESWFFNTETKELIHQYTPRPDLKEVEEHLAPMEPFAYESSDGMEVPGYLTVPQGAKAENLPVIILVHGGPKGPRDYWGYNALVQFLANRGYAVMQPNFRASGGYGKTFLNAGDLQWGKLMQDDITWGAKHLIDEGIADPEKIGIMGGSYGGYATLAGLAFTPDLYACGVDIVGPSNIFTLLESIPPYWESARAYLHGMVGDPETEEGQKLIREASPLFSADKIEKPLMIIQGANDPRVKKAESDQIVIALRDNDQPVTYLLAEDEGHGFRKPVNNMAMYAEIEKFLADELGGRYQEDMPEDVAKKLEELRVDIEAVVYEPKEAVEVAAELPSMNPSIDEGEMNYAVQMAVQGQELAMELNRTIARDGDNWVFTEVSKGPMGESTDVMTYDEDFAPVSRVIQQMGQNIEMKYSPGKIEISAAGNEMEITYEGAFISDGAGFDHLLAAMPLDKDFHLICNMADMTKMKSKEVEISVDGKESVNGVECWKVNMVGIENENEKSTFWINPDGKYAEKIEQVIPAMDNALITSVKK